LAGEGAGLQFIGPMLERARPTLLGGRFTAGKAEKALLVGTAGPGAASGWLEPPPTSLPASFKQFLVAVGIA